jgi:hypothetical protein
VENINSLGSNEPVVKKPKVFIATPMYGGMACGMYVQSCLWLQKIFSENGINHKFAFITNESLVNRARNTLANLFMEEDYTHLLFIDADIFFNPADILELIKFDKEVIAIPYPKKRIKWSNVDAAIKRGVLVTDKFEDMVGDFVFGLPTGTKQVDLSKLIEVDVAGTGLMLIKREVFEKLKENHPERRYKNKSKDDLYEYFFPGIDPESRSYLSEDYYFCRLWKQLGGKIYLCPWMKTKHVGTYAFSGDMLAVAENAVGLIGD